MDVQSDRGLLRFFRDMPDPRGVNKLHSLGAMIVMAICAVICGADGWVQVEVFAKAKRKFFESFLDVPYGIPSHDTFGKVFAGLNPEAFEACFVAWTRSLPKPAKGDLISIDGPSTALRAVSLSNRKAIRRSFARGWDKSGMAHLVSAFASSNRLVFGQLAVREKSNEITAIPKLLELLDVRGATVTIDAMGCQKNIAQQIVKAQGNYYLALKENQPTLHQKVKHLLDEAILEKFAGVQHDYFEQTNGGHGRIEKRRVWITPEVKWLGALQTEWAGLNQLVVVESIRQVTGGKCSTERRYYIASNKNATAKQAAESIRIHWGIENQLHWILDMGFDEDQCRIRTGHAAENFSRMRRIALNALEQDTTQKIGIKSKRLLAGWDNDYLLSLLTA